MSLTGRIKKKLLAKSTWFRTSKEKKKDLAHDDKLEISPKVSKKGKFRTENDDKVTKSKKVQDNHKKHPSKENIKTRSVLFVEYTKWGKLAKSLRELMSRLEKILGYKIKIVEKAGTQIRDFFPLTNLWGGIHCGRDCPPCSQMSEDQIECTKRNLVYESICATCNPTARNRGPVKTNEDLIYPSIYVGETCRSLRERAKEHWEDLKSRNEDSHMLKHQVEVHGGDEKADFIFKVVKYHQTALSRQVGEATRIRRRCGDGRILNSRGEFNRCKISRLTLNMEEYEDQSLGETPDLTEMEGDEWQMEKSIRRDSMDKELRRKMGRISEPRRKRTESLGCMEGPKDKKRKKKFKNVGEDWGQEHSEDLNLNCHLQNPRSNTNYHTNLRIRSSPKNKQTSLGHNPAKVWNSARQPALQFRK